MKQVKLEGQFILNVCSPCFDSSLVADFTPLEMPSDIEYELKSTQTLIDSIQLVKIDPTLCSESIEYEVLFNGEVVTDSTSPIRLTSNSVDSLSLQLYSEDDNLVGFSSLTYRAVTIGSDRRLLRNLQTNNRPVDPYSNSAYGTQTVIKVVPTCPDPTITLNTIPDVSGAFDQTPITIATDFSVPNPLCGNFTTVFT